MGILDNVSFWKKKEEPSLNLPHLGNEQAHDELSPLHNPALPEGQDTFGSAHGFPADPIPLGAPLTPPSSMAENNPETTTFAPRQPQQFGTPSGSNFTLGSNSQPSSYGQQSSYVQPAYQQQYEEVPPQPKPHDNLLQKDLEIISMKLDYLKATLENISQRLANLEKQDNNNNYKW